MISFAEGGRDAAFKNFKYGLKSVGISLEYLCTPVPLLCSLCLAAAAQNI